MPSHSSIYVSRASRPNFSFDSKKTFSLSKNGATASRKIIPNHFMPYLQPPTLLLLLQEKTLPSSTNSFHTLFLNYISLAQNIHKKKEEKTERIASNLSRAGNSRGSGGLVNKSKPNGESKTSPPSFFWVVLVWVPPSIV